MNLMELWAIGELVGGRGGAQVYLGLQVQQSDNLAQSAAEVEIGRMMMDDLVAGVSGEPGSNCQ